MKIAGLHRLAVRKNASGALSNAKTVAALLLLLSLLLSGCAGAALSITKVGNKSTIEASNAEDGTNMESAAFSVGKGKTVTMESALEKGQLKIEFAQATVFRHDDEEQTIVGDVVAGETVGPGDSREFPLEKGDYVMRVTVIGSTSGKVSVNVQ